MSEPEDPNRVDLPTAGASAGPTSGEPTAADRAVPAPAASSTARERVRRRMLALAPLCVVAAAPVANTACDPAPDPYCAQSSSEIRLESLYADARWVAGDAGALLVELDLTVSTLYPLSLAPSFSVTGGSLEQSTQAGSGYALTIRPSQSSTEVQVTGTVDCQGSATGFTVTLALATPGEAGAVIPTNIH